MKQWYGTELSKEEAEIFREYLLKQGIQYEASEVYHLIHFECCMTDDEAKSADNWIVENISNE